MSLQERIDILNAALAKLQSAIAQTNTALGTAVDLGSYDAMAAKIMAGPGVYRKGFRSKRGTG